MLCVKQERPHLPFPISLPNFVALPVYVILLCRPYCSFPLSGCFLLSLSPSVTPFCLCLSLSLLPPSVSAYRQTLCLCQSMSYCRASRTVLSPFLCFCLFSSVTPFCLCLFLSVTPFCLCLSLSVTPFCLCLCLSLCYPLLSLPTARLCAFDSLCHTAAVSVCLFTSVTPFCLCLSLLPPSVSVSVCYPLLSVSLLPRLYLCYPLLSVC